MRILFAFCVLCVVVALGRDNEEKSAQPSVVHKDYGPKADPAVVTAKRLKQGYYNSDPEQYTAHRMNRRPTHRRQESRRPGHRRPGHRKPENRRFDRKRPNNHRRPIRHRHSKRTGY
uniref:Uncharacterized protein n=1 Tax=Heliothis virescens TaxID=7102 RepID=A0A2A4JEH7_HELVI